MARCSETGRTDLFVLQPPLCPDCKRKGTCRDFNLHHRDAIFASINGYQVQCTEYQPLYYHGLEGVRP